MGQAKDALFGTVSGSNWKDTIEESPHRCVPIGNVCSSVAWCPLCCAFKQVNLIGNGRGVCVKCKTTVPLNGKEKSVEEKVEDIEIMERPKC